MPTAIITGSGGLIGSESVRHFVEAGYDVIGLENDMRAQFFGADASTAHTTDALLDAHTDAFRSLEIDIRDADGVSRIFSEHAAEIELVIHTAAQPSHDWAASAPQTDFAVNANGTLNLLEATRLNAPAATFIFCSTNKVYGDRPNSLPLLELEQRLELPEEHAYYRGIDTSMSIDSTTHSLFGVSKAAADLLVQEYGRYFEMPTVCFRGGCLTGPNHAGTQLHGFLSYLMRCTMTGEPYTVFGYGGKQVRDNIHAADLVAAFEAFHRAPRPAAVYNIGGGRQSNCSMLEAIDLCQQIAGRELDWTLGEDNRIGDHRWWISDLEPFKGDYPGWDINFDVADILRQIHDRNAERWLAGADSVSG
jgi:CDP-paratose 2-epimerase